VWFSKPTSTDKSPSGIQDASPLQRAWRIVARNGNNDRIAEHVFGARDISQVAVRV
jgi:hypothetical protein